MQEEKNIDAAAAGFYDSVAADYDAMTGFERRFVLERPFFRLLVEQNAIKSALDAGCGTGFHSLLLSQLGVAVTAVDVSPEMVRRTLQHAEQAGVQLKALQSSFAQVRNAVDSNFDAVFSLGNSVAHLLNPNDIFDALAGFASVLAPNGTLFVQLLNYDRILLKRERIQNVKQVQQTMFVRFYDYENDLVRFNILKLDKKGDDVEHHLLSIPLRPIRSTEIASLLRQAGFAQVSIYGGISLEKYSPETSKDIFVVARR
ncbi:MAG: class I SAM-dependent methyltransferase [Ignavibacteriae bacterium]|nr:class I SAM-dependent methyltransferase [Ignavibacteriota bacterium]